MITHELGRVNKYLVNCYFVETVKLVFRHDKSLERPANGDNDAKPTSSLLPLLLKSE